MQSLKYMLNRRDRRRLWPAIFAHPEFGMMYYASVFTEMELPPDVNGRKSTHIRLA